jgi:hypothetical protein
MAQTKRTQRTEPEQGHVCPVGFCPVGMFLSVTDRARPEAVEHLVAAGREFVQALAAVLNTRVEDLGRSPSVEKIEIE